MRNLIIIGALLLICSEAGAQTRNDFICVGGKTFTIPSIWRRSCSDAVSSFDMRYSVKRGKAILLSITAIDSNTICGLPFLMEETRLNFSRITFLKDTADAHLRMTYSMLPSADVSTDFAQFISPNEIHLTFRIMTTILRDGSGRVTGDSVTLYESLVTQDSIASGANILVEKFFDRGKDSAIIRVNNHPWLKDEIYEAARFYTQQYFQDDNSHGKWFFIQFTPYHHFPECNDAMIHY